MDVNEFDAWLGEVENDPVETLTVSVCLRPSVAKKRAELLKAVEAARRADAAESASAANDGRLGVASPEPSTAHADAAIAELEEYDDEVAKALVSIKFSRLPGDKWAGLTLAYPARLGVQIDRQYGYNIDGLTMAGARLSGVRVDDDGEHEITADQWDRMLKKLAGHDVELIRDAVWMLNEGNPEQNIAALVKPSGAA